MVSAMGLHCSVCNTTFSTRKEWCYHLLQPSHQNQARIESLSWDLKVKECVLVAFAKFPIAGEDVLYQFTLRERNTIVTDFVWSEHRPHVGIIQFESRHKAEEVLEESGRNPVLVDEQLVQLRRAIDYLELEWDELLERFNSKTSDDNSSTVKSSLKRKRSKDNGENSKEITTGEENERVKAPLISLHDQFSDICDEVEISDKEFNQALEIMEKCRQIFSTRYQACQLYMFRHWYLKLWSHGTNELLFFLDANGEIDNSDPDSNDYVQAFRLSLEDIEKFLTSPSAQQILPGVRRRQNTTEAENLEARAYQFEHEPSGLKFSIVADDLFMTEVQTCRLVKYLWNFDPRVRSFFILMHFWARENRADISTPVYKDPVKSHAFAPEPAGLEWMIITFLAQKGVLPKPWEVLQRPHKKMLIFQKYDVGFAADHTFSNEWRHSSAANFPSEQKSNQFYLHLLELQQNFFQFYAQLASGTWILNTRDAELLPRQAFFETEPQHQLRTRLTPGEIRELKHVSKKYILTQVNLEGWSVSILHPLFLGWCIIFWNERFRESTSFKMIASQELLQKSLREIAEGRRSKHLKTMIGRVRFDRVKKRILGANSTTFTQKLGRKRKLHRTDD